MAMKSTVLNHRMLHENFTKTRKRVRPTAPKMRKNAGDRDVSRNKPKEERLSDEELLRIELDSKAKQNKDGFVLYLVSAAPNHVAPNDEEVPLILILQKISRAPLTLLKIWKSLICLPFHDIANHGTVYPQPMLKPAYTVTAKVQPRQSPRMRKPAH